ncbi:SNF2 family N-terminal domain-containing protein [Podospora aff. communis PSN243]|uniref:SNF2 family N-terminal domain-containing protein n=1 Tax=Podospora aff. communis PSN243 TaxID=3040156 RepID=A0AAV9H0R4_9PEZI|nr:SNF2 family N-terminal domain-containing protein [Podospora aff. communis PSN243]
MPKKPGAYFAVQPQNNLSSNEKPNFEVDKRRARKSTLELRQSFYDLVQSTTISYSSSPSTPNLPDTNSIMARQRSESFGDDDLDFISSQTANMSLGNGGDDFTTTPLHARLNRDIEVIDLSQSPSASKQATPTPKFGHPTKLPSHFVKKRDDPDGVFHVNRNRVELHKDLYKSKGGPLKPKSSPKKAPSLPMFSSMSETAQPVSQSNFGDQVFYTDPAKASADLKALLEGGMEDEEEEAQGEGGGEAPKSKEDALEDGTLEGISVKLLPHQVEGVKWMRNRELGPLKRGKVPKGGILADDMGLGKTLQSISLIISNQMPQKDEPGWKKHFEHIKRATLVVAPLALIRQWEAELKDKITKEHQLKVCVHHGPQRTKDPKVLARYDVVITTYQILVSEHGNSSPNADGLQAGCFGIHWYRVILDEAHSIKNRNAKATKAACALRSEYRWCLTGTPMQNNLDELQSLVHFLRIQPYDDLSEWRANIDAPMKNGKGHIAIRRLHSLLRCFMKRRTKEILKEEGALVAGGKKALESAAAKAEKEGKEMVAPKSAFKITERKVVTVETEFTPAEREFYAMLEERADRSLEKMMAGNVNYASALVLLLRLRQACNHPRLAETKVDKDRDALAVGDTAAQAKAADTDVDALADAFGGMGIQTKKCDMCLNELSKREAAAGMLRCSVCEEALEKVNNQSPSQKKARRKSRVSIVKEEIKIEKVQKRKPKNRKIIVDSDDEEEEGSWLVPEDQRESLRLGKAGGTDDEDADGGGDDVGSEDSEGSSAEDDDNGSDLDSFVVNDEPADGEKARTLDDDDSGSDDNTFVSVSKIHSQRQEVHRSDTSDDDTNASISESELMSGSDSDDESAARSMKRSRKKNGSSNSVMVSAKIRELLGILRKEAAEHKFIVFSQFTSMLDLIEPFLRSQPGLKAVRYDGKMPNDAREAALHSLRNDPHTRILLCSLKCGSLGLNLTAATRVVIVEPFWNPFVEEQAIDRVHRLTQTVDVIVYKLTVADTVEARILELQNKKRLLAEATIEGGMRKDKNALKLGLKEILDLFKHDAARRGIEGEEVDPRDVARDLRGVMGVKKGRKEHEVYGRRW